MHQEGAAQPSDVVTPRRGSSPAGGQVGRGDAPPGGLLKGPSESPMEFVGAQDIYTARWPQFGLEIEFDLLRTTSGGDLTAQATVRDASEGGQRVVHVGRVTLTGARSLSDYATYVTKLDQQRFKDFNRMLARAARQTVVEHRKGEPAILLKDAQPRPDGGWLLRPLVRADGATILYGDGGSGKSYLALAIAAALQAGDAELLGMMPTTTLRVGYLDWEWEASDHLERLRKLLGDHLPEIVYVPCRLSLAEELDRLRTIIREHQLDFLIVDSVALACDGPPEAAEVTMRFFGALRRLGLPSLCLAHVNRSGDVSRPFGSVFWHDSARATWFVERQPESDLLSLTVTLSNKKLSGGARQPPIALEFEFETGRTFIRRIDVSDVVREDEPKAAHVQVAEELRSGPHSYRELAGRLGLPEATVRKAVQRSVDHFVEIPGPGRARLVALRSLRDPSE